MQQYLLFPASKFLPLSFQAGVEGRRVGGARAARVRERGAGVGEGPGQVSAPRLRHSPHGGGGANRQGRARRREARCHLG